MPPICDPDATHAAKNSKKEDSSTPQAQPRCTAEPDAMSVYGPEDSTLSDPEPFYGMFDRHEEDDDSSCWLQLPSPRSSPRGVGGSIPEASETFRRVLKQLDAAGPTLCGQPRDHSDTRSPPREKPATPASGRPERKSSKVQKSASFSTPPASRSTATTTSSSSSGPDSKRRMSVPCVRNSKHVQWADEAGVSNLVSVRLIRPRLSKGDKEEAAAHGGHPPSRSILRRLSGMR